MPAFLLIGWLVGLALGGIATALALVSAGVTLPAMLAPFLALLAPRVAVLSPPLLLLVAPLLLLLSYVVAYAVATASIAPLLPGLTGLAAPIFPLAAATAAPAAPVAVPATPGEFFGRGMMIGLTATTNAALLALVPFAGAALAAWSFAIVSLSAVIPVARNRVFQGFLGWTSWLCPVSHLATAVGLLLFVVNTPFALLMFGPAAFGFDWTTGVVSQAGGLAATATQASGFSLGNFVFLRAVPAPGAFTTPSVSSHETGHSLNTAALGGVVLWLNAIDENVLPPRQNLAYGELTAEGHAQRFGATQRQYYSRLWV